jgi:hypothetical protein
MGVSEAQLDGVGGISFALQAIEGAVGSNLYRLLKNSVLNHFHGKRKFSR